MPAVSATSVGKNITALKPTAKAMLNNILPVSFNKPCQLNFESLKKEYSQTANIPVNITAINPVYQLKMIANAIVTVRKVMLLFVRNLCTPSSISGSI